MIDSSDDNSVNSNRSEVVSDDIKKINKFLKRFSLNDKWSEKNVNKISDIIDGWVDTDIPEYDNECLNFIGLYYLYIAKKYEKAEEIFLLSIERGNQDSRGNLADLYIKQRRFKKTEEYLKIFVDQGDILSICKLASLLFSENEYEAAERYCLIAVEKGKDKYLSNLVEIYKKLNKHDKIEELFIKKEKFYELGEYYSKKGLIEKAEKFYLLAIEKEKNINNCLVSLTRLYRDESSIKVYKQLLKCNNLNPDVQINIKEMKELECIKIFLKREKEKIIEENDKIYDKCGICYENKEVLTLKCNHTICVSCFNKIDDICPFCRQSLI